MRKIALIGGDSRQIYAAATLKKAGFTPFVYGNDGAAGAGVTAPYTMKETLADAEAVLLPVPSVKKKGFLNAPHTEESIACKDVWENVPRHATVFLWEREHCLPPDGMRTVDLAEDEILQSKNAAITAEAALLLAMRESKRQLAGSRMAVVGYGRIGKHLCRLASAWGASVAVVARQGRNRNLAQSQGFAVKDPSEQGLFSDTELIFNTVPVPFLNEKSFSSLQRDALYFELASQPGGIDPSCAPPLPVIPAQGLPGKYCPQSAGRALAEAVMLHLEVEKW